MRAAATTSILSGLLWALCYFPTPTTAFSSRPFARPLTATTTTRVGLLGTPATTSAARTTTYRQLVASQQQQQSQSRRCTWTRLLAASSSSHNSHRDDDKSDPAVTRRRSRIRQHVRRWLVSLALATTVWRNAQAPAQAKFAYELRDTPTASLRPGVSAAQAAAIDTGDLDGRAVVTPTTTTTTPAPSTKSAASPNNDYDDYEDDDADFLDDQAMVRSSSIGGSAISSADQAAAARLQGQTSFASKRTAGKTTALTAKVGVAFFLPTYGTLIVREYVRRRREENYVQKGLEIMKVQKAEYFNITGTAADSDVEDALKSLKKNETATDEDDDDDDDDDEDDDDDDDDDEEDERPRGRRSPPRPSGGGGSGSNGGGGEDTSGPSEEDLNRLNQMFKRS
jgi:hypothetical protein